MTDYRVGDKRPRADSHDVGPRGGASALAGARRDVSVIARLFHFGESVLVWTSSFTYRGRLQSVTTPAGGASSGKSIVTLVDVEVFRKHTPLMSPHVLLQEQTRRACIGNQVPPAPPRKPEPMRRGIVELEQGKITAICPTASGTQFVSTWADPAVADRALATWTPGERSTLIFQHKPKPGRGGRGRGGGRGFGGGRGGRGGFAGRR